MKLQKVTLTIAYHDGKYVDPRRWDWWDLVDVNRDCQIIDITTTDPEDMSEEDAERILDQWDGE